MTNRNTRNQEELTKKMKQNKKNSKIIRLGDDCVQGHNFRSTVGGLCTLPICFLNGLLVYL